MNKRILLISGILLTTIFGGLGLYNVIDNKSRLVITNEKIEQVMKTNALTMMYETEAGSGEYRVSNDTSWPQEGYVFNEKLSDCENGGTLSWNDETKRVVLTTSTFDKCYVYFDKYLPTIINSVSASDISNNSITLTVNATVGENPIQVYYYSNNGGSSYVESNSNTYTFNGLETGTEYEFRVYVIDSNGVSSEVYSLQATTESAVYLANYIKSLYTSDGANGIYLHDGIGSYTNANLEAGDNSYRYAGANPNNYVCFGSDVTPCPNDNLYRIIGIFNINDNYQTKLIKNTSIGKYAWNTEYTTEWNTSDIRVILNNTYYNSLSGKYQNLIYNTTWSIGGIRLMNGMYSNAKEAYNYEIGANKVNKTDIAKVALMYLSDYYYSASPTYWNYSGNNIDDQSQSYASAKNENWIFSTLDEFTLSYIIDFSSFIFTITDSGAINSASSPFIPQNDVRPSFYLNPDVAYVSGDGTISNPYRIN